LPAWWQLDASAGAISDSALKRAEARGPESRFYSASAWLESYLEIFFGWPLREDLRQAPFAGPQHSELKIDQRLPAAYQRAQLPYPL